MTQNIVYSRADVDAAAHEIIEAQLALQPTDYAPDTDITGNDVGADSIDHVNIIMELEDHFGIAIPDAEAEKLKTPHLLCEWIWERLMNEGRTK